MHMESGKDSVLEASWGGSDGAGSVLAHLKL